ncbi:MAG TPA: DUF4129 domain-containing protein [Streptosporangiaceae bacterium]
MIGLAMAWLAGPGRPAGGTLIGRLPAQRLARRELARSIYQPSLFQRLARSVSRLLDRLFVHLNVAVPGGWWALIALAIVVVLAAALILQRIGPARSRRSGRGGVLTSAARTARDHRDEAERSAAAGDFTAAIIERVRAIAVELEERGVLQPRPGRTAAELAAEAGHAMPVLAGDLTPAARLFDDVRYGGRTGAAAGYQLVSDLDDRVQAASRGSAAGPELAVPGSGGPRPQPGLPAGRTR